MSAYGSTMGDTMEITGGPFIDPVCDTYSECLEPYKAVEGKALFNIVARRLVAKKLVK